MPSNRRVRLLALSALTLAFLLTPPGARAEIPADATPPAVQGDAPRATIGAGPAAGAEPGPIFPRALSSYAGEEGMTLRQILVHRAQADPLNWIASVIFLLAVLHT